MALQVWQGLVLGLMVVFSVAAALWMAWKEIKRAKEDKDFFLEAEKKRVKEMGSPVSEAWRRAGVGTGKTGEEDEGAEYGGGIANLVLAEEQINAYETTKKKMYDSFAEKDAVFSPFEKVKKKKSKKAATADAYSDDSDDEDEEDLNGEGSEDEDNEDGDEEDDEEEESTALVEPAVEPWHRKLPPDAKRHLKALLVKRAMGCIPAVRMLSQEFQAKARLNQLQMMNPLHWERIQEFRILLDREIVAIRREAESIETGFGKDDSVFRSANTVYMHQIKKAQMQKEEAQREKQRKEELEREKKLAERMTKELLRQEELEERQNKAREEKAARQSQLQKQNLAAAKLAARQQQHQSNATSLSAASPTGSADRARSQSSASSTNKSGAGGDDDGEPSGGASPSSTSLLATSTNALIADGSPSSGSATASGKAKRRRGKK